MTLFETKNRMKKSHVFTLAEESHDSRNEGHFLTAAIQWINPSVTICIAGAQRKKKTFWISSIQYMLLQDKLEVMEIINATVHSDKATGFFSQLAGPQCELQWVVGGRRGLARIIRGSDLLQTGLHAPDLPGILGNGAVTGEFTTASNVMDHLLGPFFRVLLIHRGVGGYVNNMEICRAVLWSTDRLLHSTLL